MFKIKCIIATICNHSGYISKADALITVILRDSIIAYRVDTVSQEKETHYGLH